MVIPRLLGANQTLSLRIMPGLNRYMNVQTGRRFTRCGFKRTHDLYSTRPPLEPLQSQPPRVLGCHAATVGPDASRAQDTFHTPVLLSEVLAVFSEVNLKVCRPESACCPFELECFALCSPEQLRLTAVQAYIDGTLGAAGHAQAIIQQHPVGCSSSDGVAQNG